jgi:hypothetical protein
MSVNLDRLREALGNEPEVTPSAIHLGHLAGEEDHRLVLDTARTVLDAPRVWWCAAFKTGTQNRKESCPHGLTLGCGWVVLVPVEGGGL